MFFFEYRSKAHRILVHLIFWVVYLAFFTILSFVNPSVKIGFFEIGFRGLIYLPVDISATYFTIYFLLPRFFLKKEYLTFALLFTLLGFVTIFVNQSISYYITYPLLEQKVPPVSFFDFSLWGLWYTLVSTYAVVILATGIKVAKLWLMEEQAKAKLEAARAQSEIALLKYQLNPHFIFNTLNNIDTLIHKNPVQASRCIMKLSEIMRYVAYESEADKVPVEREVSYLQSFIDLQQLRFGRKLIHLEVDIRTPGKMIAPMLFIPLVENAIKHGDKHGNTPTILVKLTVDTAVDFLVKNSLASEITQKDKMGGIGLKNLQRRLDLIYPGTHLFKCLTSDDPAIYTAHLWIQ